MKRKRGQAAGMPAWLVAIIIALAILIVLIIIIIASGGKLGDIGSALRSVTRG